MLNVCCVPHRDPERAQGARAPDLDHAGELNTTSIVFCWDNSIQSQTRAASRVDGSCAHSTLPRVHSLHHVHHCSRTCLRTDNHLGYALTFCFSFFSCSLHGSCSCHRKGRSLFRSFVVSISFRFARGQCAQPNRQRSTVNGQPPTSGHLLTRPRASWRYWQCWQRWQCWQCWQNAGNAGKNAGNAVPQRLTSSLRLDSRSAQPAPVILTWPATSRSR